MFKVTRTSIYGLERAITIARAMEESAGRHIDESDSNFNAVAPCLVSLDIQVEENHQDETKYSARMNCADCSVAPPIQNIELLGWEAGCDNGVRQVFNTVGPKDFEILMKHKNHCLKIITVNSCIKAPLHWWGEMSRYINTDPSDGVPILMNICSDKLHQKI